MNTSVQDQSDSSQHLTPGSIFAEHFRIVDEIGRGGYSTVYKAEDLALSRTVALKILKHSLVHDARARDRLRKEARTATRLDHPNIARIYSFGLTSDHHPYLAMEFVDGITLSSYLKQRGALPLDDFRNLIEPLLSALSYAHKATVIHRDIKPGNIMLDAEMQPKIVDFGLAKAQFSANGESTNTISAAEGTPLYMSPEQCSGRPMDHRTDIYSLCCLMYECLAGKPPFAGDTAYETMYEHLTSSVPDLDALSGQVRVPTTVASVVMKGLSKDPDARQQSADELSNELNLAFQNQSRKRRKNPALPIATVCLVIVLSLGATTVLTKMDNQRIEPVLPEIAERKQAKSSANASSRMLFEQAKSLYTRAKNLLDEKQTTDRQMYYNSAAIDAIDLTRQAIARENEKTDKDKGLLYEIYELAACICADTGSPKLTVEYMTSARNVSTVQVDKLHATYRIGTCLRENNKIDSAIEALQEGTADFTSRDCHPVEELALCYRELGKCLEKKGKFTDAFKVYQKGFDIYCAVPSRLGYPDAIYQVNDLIDCAHKCKKCICQQTIALLNAYPTADTDSDNFGLPDSLAEIANTCMKRGHYKEARKLFARAISSSTVLSKSGVDKDSLDSWKASMKRCEEK